jgi:CelD/BcsL family acetyltransferase involved in cellulose biosynthesis
MKLQRIPGHELTPEITGAWSELLARQPSFEGPYFRPEFTAAVAAVRRDVEVAVWEEQGRLAGFFPFQRSRFDVGHPVGGKMSDFQAFLVEEHASCSAAELIRGCRLAAWHFDHLLAEQSLFASHHAAVEPSPYMDLSAGYSAYVETKLAAKSKTVSRVRRHARDLEKQAGPLRFELHEPTPAAFQWLLAQKSEQYQRTGAVDIFRFRWVVELLERIRDTQTPNFSGVLSTLYAGDSLVAAHLGMRTLRTLHWWFPTFDRAFSKGSPGLILLLRVAEAAAAGGVRRIDLGKGSEQYKSSFQSGATLVAGGSSIAAAWSPALAAAGERRSR